MDDAMGTTVRDLLERPDLRTRLIAGEAGIDRPVTWAHVCELEDPTAWLSGGELVMTVGIGIPRDAAGQVAYVERLAQAQLSGVMICEGMRAPALSEEMLEAADRLGLPVMLTAYEVPFVAVSRVVADANLEDEHGRLRRTLQVYEVARLVVHAGLTDSKFIARLERIVGGRLVVVDAAMGRVLLPPEASMPPSLIPMLRQTLERYPHDHVPAVIQLPEVEPSTIALAVPSRRRAFMVVSPRWRRAAHDIVVLRHVATVVALALERMTADLERKHRLGAELFAHLADRRMTPDLALDLLVREQHLPAPPYLVVAIAEDSVHLADLQHSLEASGVPHLALRREGCLFLLLPDGEEISAALDAHLTSTPQGVSARLSALSRVPEAMLEARWALQQAREAGKGRVRYGEEGLDAASLPSSIEGARSLVERVLGPLLAYDASHERRLFASLRSFLEHDRSWSETARALGIHRQTLVYRLRKVEALTGLRVDRTADLVTLWLAVRAAAALGLDGNPTLSSTRRGHPAVSGGGAESYGRRSRQSGKVTVSA
jgi:purine catabolism regulator